MSKPLKLMILIGLLTSAWWLAPIRSAAADANPWFGLATGSCEAPVFTAEVSAGQVILLLSGDLMPGSPFNHAVTPYGETSRPPWWSLNQTSYVDPTGNICVEAFATAADDYGTFLVTIHGLDADQRQYNPPAMGIVVLPAPAPTASPTPAPAETATPEPSDTPTSVPSETPAVAPTATGTPDPTNTPTTPPTDTPSPVPPATETPGTGASDATEPPAPSATPAAPTVEPTLVPSQAPTQAPPQADTRQPTLEPTATPGLPTPEATTKPDSQASNIPQPSQEPGSGVLPTQAASTIGTQSPTSTPTVASVTLESPDFVPVTGETATRIVPGRLEVVLGLVGAVLLVAWMVSSFRRQTR